MIDEFSFMSGILSLKGGYGLMRGGREVSK